jgi:hypothetical protein
MIDFEIADANAFEWQELLAGLGVEAVVERTLPHRAASPFDWIVLLALPLHALLSTVGALAMTDLYAAAKRLGSKRSESARPPLVLEDSGTGLRVILEADLPPEALAKLCELELHRFRHGPLRYDKDRKAWRSELDEAEM